MVALYVRRRHALAAIEAELQASAPQLASMYAMFGRLTSNERVVTGAEQVPPARRFRVRPRGWSWPGRWADVAAVVMLVSFLASGLVLAVRAHPVPTRCPQPTVAAQSSSMPSLAAMRNASPLPARYPGERCR